MTGLMHSTEQIREIILNDYPDMPLDELGLHDTLHSRIYSARVAGKEFIFKFPRNDHYNMIQEIRILSHFRNHFKLPIPQIAFAGRSYPYIAYPRLHGEVLTTRDLAEFTPEALDSLAHDAARFLLCFHETPTEMTQSLAICQDPSRGYPKRVRHFVEENEIQEEFETFINKLLDAFEERAGKGDDAETFIYNDLNLGNMLFDRDKQCLTGMLDFGFCGIGYVHRDFHQFHKHGIDLLKRLIASYTEQSGREIDYDLVVMYSAVDMLGYMVGGYEQRPDLVDGSVPLFMDIMPWMHDPDLKRILSL